jgi:outer membrane murein-binding lipoprotein Lpp
MKRATFLVAVVLLLLGTSGCASRTGSTADLARLEAEKQQLQSQVTALQGRLAELEGRATGTAPAGKPVNLINPNYPPAVAGTEGWVYHKMRAADFDGDGAEESLHVTNNAYWDAARGEFGWDDGHPWHVYVEEADGTRTYLFSGWVQLGRLLTMVTAESPTQVVLLVESGTGLAVYQVDYRGPGKTEALELASVGINGFAGFADPFKYRE